MQCYQCGAKIRPGLSICSNCGARLDASTEYEGTDGAGPPAYGGDDGPYEMEPSEPYRPRGENPGQARRGARGYGRDSYRNKADPLEDPRAPRFANESVTPAPRPSRREVSGRSDRGAEYGRGGRSADPAGRDRPLKDAGGRYDSYDRQESYRDNAGRNSPPTPGRPMPERSRRPQIETRDDRRNPRSAYDGRGNRPYPSRDQTGGDDQNGRWDRAGGRSRTGRDSPVLQLQSPAWKGKGGGSATTTFGKPATRRWVAILVAAAVILTLSIGAVAALRGTSLLSRIRGGSPISDNAPPFVAYTPGPTPAPPAGYKEFDSPHSLYVLDYPQSWSTSSSSTGAGGAVDYVDELTRTLPLATVIVEEAGAFSSITRSEIIQAEVQGAHGGGRAFTQVSNPITTVKIAGEQWLRADYLITETDGAKFHMAILACHHNQRGYALVLLGLPDTFSQDTVIVFEPILNTFHFTG